MKLRGSVGIAALSVWLLAGSGCIWTPELDGVRRDIESQLPGVTFEREVAFSLGPVALSLAKTALKLTPDTGTASAYVRDLRRVSVAVYSAQDIPHDLELRLPASLARLLESGAWELVVKTRDDGEAVWILCKVDGDSIDGMYVVVLDRDELVLVRAHGRLEEIFKRAIQEHVTHEHHL